MTPGEAERAHAELRRAADALEEARALLDLGMREGAASRLYYAVFHAARAALIVRGLHAKTHSGQISLFNQTFGVEPLLGALAEMRAEADYALAEFTKPISELRAQSDAVASLIERCRSIVEEAVARGPDEPDPPPDL